MLKATIVIDLPSTERAKTGPVAWVRSLFGSRTPERSGKEELSVGAFSVVQGVIAAFATAGVTDALAFLVDKQVVYVDTDDIADDAALIVEAAQITGVLDRPFKEMRIALAHEDATLRTVFDCAITNQVVLGEAEMTISVASRLVELSARPGETAQGYADRVAAATQPATFDAARAALDLLVGQVATALRAAIAGATVTPDPARIEITRATKIATSPPWGAHVVQPGLRGEPPYFDDPYYDVATHVVAGVIAKAPGTFATAKLT